MFCAIVPIVPLKTQDTPCVALGFDCLFSVCCYMMKLQGMAFAEEAFPGDCQVQAPDASDDPPSPKLDGKKGRGGKKKKDGASRAGGKAPKKQPLTICIVPDCSCPKYPGSRFCSLKDHKKAFDNMCYQRRSRSISPEERDAFDTLMRDDGEAGKMVGAFAKDNPPEMKKKGLVDFASFVRIVGERLGTHSQAGCKPMSERAWYKHAENVEGYTEEEAQEQWKIWLNDKVNIKRDFQGFRGCERLWVPVYELEMQDRCHYLDNRVVEGSDHLKAPSLGDRKMLQDRAFAQIQIS